MRATAAESLEGGVSTTTLAADGRGGLLCSVSGTVEMAARTPKKRASGARLAAGLVAVASLLSGPRPAAAPTDAELAELTASVRTMIDGAPTLSGWRSCAEGDGGEQCENPSPARYPPSSLIVSVSSAAGPSWKRGGRGDEDSEAAGRGCRPEEEEEVRVAGGGQRRRK